MDAILATVAESPLHLLLGVAVTVALAFYSVRETQNTYPRKNLLFS